MSRMRQYLFECGVSPHEIQQQRGKGGFPSLLENRLDHKGPPLYAIGGGHVQWLRCPLLSRFWGRFLIHICLPLKGTAAPEYSGAAYISGLFPARLLLFFRFDASPYLSRIPGERGYCLLFMGRRWRGRHNSTTPLRRKKHPITCLCLLAKARSWCRSSSPRQICALPGLPCAAGFRLKSMDGREQVSLFPIQVNASWLLNQFTRTYVDRSDSLSMWSPFHKPVIPAARPIPLLHGFRTRNTVYSVVDVRMKGKEKMRPSLSTSKRGYSAPCFQTVQKIFLFSSKLLGCFWIHSDGQYVLWQQFLLLS